jgi:hypothetical protein
MASRMSLQHRKVYQKYLPQAFEGALSWKEIAHNFNELCSGRPMANLVAKLQDEKKAEARLVSKLYNAAKTLAELGDISPEIVPVFRDPALRVTDDDLFDGVE